MPRSDLTTRLLPVLGRSLDIGFNVFDVMHHGTHEKQLSNVFRWLLDIGGTHGFGALGQAVFVELVNLHRAEGVPLPQSSYSVRQEVNTSNADEGGDVADIVLENDSAVIVIENFETSDGHGHGYQRYLSFAERRGKTGAVVLLCETEDRALLRGGWERAAVIPYALFLERLVATLALEADWATRNVAADAFIQQMHTKYVKERGRMSDEDLLEFVAAMCTTGEAKRYQEQNQAVAAEQFANDLAQQARESFGEGREVLLRVKQRLRSYASGVLVRQLDELLGAGAVGNASTRYQGIYQWTVNFETGGGETEFGEARLQIKFGPSAWFANERDPHWTQTVAPEVADYTRLFLTKASTHELRQSSVSLREVLSGLPANDTRLRDEIVELLSAA